MKPRLGLDDPCASPSSLGYSVMAVYLYLMEISLPLEEEITHV